MKLNFWQVLGIVLVVVAALYLMIREMRGRSQPAGSPAPTSRGVMGP